MHKLFADHPNFDFNSDQVKEIRETNNELTELGKKRDTLKEEKGAIEQMRLHLEQQGVVQRPQVYGTTASAGGRGGTKTGRPIWRKTIGQILIAEDGFRDIVAKRPTTKGRTGPSFEMDLAWMLAGNPLMAPEDLQDEKGWDPSEVKALLDTTGYPLQNIRLPGVAVQVPFRTPMVQELIPSTGTNQQAIPYLEETTATNNAAAVAEGATKPESALAFTDRTSPVRKLATNLPVTDEALDDVPSLQGYVDNRLGFFLRLEWERQLLLGSGVAPNLTGILNTAGIQTQAKGADPTPDAFYLAIQKIRTVAFMEPTAIVMHPDDWSPIRLLRTADGIYIWGSPSEEGPERLWSLPVRITPLITANTGLVGAFNVAAQQFIRRGVSFSMSTEHANFFTDNKVMLQVEMRLALVVYRPTGFCTVTGI
jgi:hypothetical protein